MTRDDFSMYFANSYLTTKAGNLCYITGLDGSTVVYAEYLDKDHTERKTTTLRSIHNHINLKPFKLKPFANNGRVYSPSFRAVRGYKDGVNDSRVDFNEVGSAKETSHGDTIPSMFFEQVLSKEEGIHKIVSGQDTYASIEDDFLLLKKVDKDNQDPEPFSSIQGYQNDNGHLVLEDTARREEYTLRPQMRMVRISPDLPEKVRQLVERLSRHTHWQQGFIPQQMQNTYLSWLERHSKPEVPKIELYRCGMLICDILEEPTDVLKGLPRLTTFIEELRSEYVRQTTGR